jgi:hypothetical protein
MPATAEELSSWIGLHPDLAPSPEMDEAVQFLSDPPLDPALKLGYKVLLEAAVATLPRRVAAILGLTRTPGAVSAGRVAVSGLRWALGYSPSWKLALIRAGSPVPEGRFKQKMAIER